MTLTNFSETRGMKDFLSSSLLETLLDGQKELVQNLQIYNPNKQPAELMYQYLTSKAKTLYDQFYQRFNGVDSESLAHLIYCEYDDTFAASLNVNSSLSASDCNKIINLVTCYAYLENKWVCNLLSGVGVKEFINACEVSINDIKILLKIR